MLSVSLEEKGGKRYTSTRQGVAIIFIQFRKPYAHKPGKIDSSGL